MMVYIDRTGTVRGFEQMVWKISKNGQARTLLVLACDANGFDPGQLDPVLRSLPMPVLGGIFPTIFHGTTQLEKGTIVVALQSRSTCIQIDQLSDPSMDFISAIDRQIEAAPAFRTMLVIIDGFSRRINALINSLFTVFGLEHNYIGGGAGSLSMKPKPCVITNDGLKSDVGVIALLDSPSSVGVGHGWTSIAGPFRITESKGNVVKTIDWLPAFELYSKVLTQYGKVRINPENFFSIAKGFPFGIAKFEAECVVRDLVRITPEGYLVSVGELPEGSFVEILNGTAQSLLSATLGAKTKCAANHPRDLKRPLTLFFDCISRLLFLGEGSIREIETAATPGLPLVGAGTIGEIANTGSAYIEFYNKTAVVGLLEGACNSPT